MSIDLKICPAKDLCRTTFGTKVCARTLGSINIPPTIDLGLSITTRQAANVASFLAGLPEPFTTQPQANVQDVPISRLQKYAKALGF